MVREARMAGQPGLFDSGERLRALSAAGDPLEQLAAVGDFELSERSWKLRWTALTAAGVAGCPMTQADVSGADPADALHAVG